MTPRSPATALLAAVLLGPGLLTGLLVGLLVTATPAAACSCAGLRSDVEAAEEADAVFVGRLVDRREPRDLPFTSSSDPVVVIFDVTAVHKGDVAARQAVWTANSGASCGLELRGRGPFVVFAQRGNAWLDVGEEDLTAFLCGGTRPLADAPLTLATAPPPQGTSDVPEPGLSVLVVTAAGFLGAGVAGALLLPVVRRRRSS